MTKSECEIKIDKKIVKKKFKKSEEGRRLYLNELSIYLLARQKKLKYIPKLISYDIVKREIVTENVGKSLDFEDLGLGTRPTPSNESPGRDIESRIDETF